ncbi:MAG: putative ABC transporter permease [Clostridiales bacterium]|nr:putative ABC transporter permease [Clostridiales bacterium]
MSDKSNNATQQTENQSLNYQNLFWLFMIANVIGVIMEGVWTIYKFHRWETHVNSIWGPFCFIYGIGAVIFYIGSVKLKNRNFLIQFVVFALAADVVEYFSSLLIEETLGMKAWTYHKHFMNLQGRISLPMTIIWGITGITYLHLLEPRIYRLFKKMQGKAWKVACIALSAFMVVNIAATAMCLVRWSQRHKGIPASNKVEEFIDSKYDDDRMRHLFCEWWFIDEGEEFWAEYKKK